MLLSLMLMTLIVFDVLSLLLSLLLVFKILESSQEFRNYFFSFYIIGDGLSNNMALQYVF